MHNNENIIHLFNWLTKQLNNDNSTELKTNIVVDTPWSTVIKVELGLTCNYLKQTHSDLFIESDVINFIHMKIPSAPVPEIRSINGAATRNKSKQMQNSFISTSLRNLLDNEKV